jgi:plasmid stabilization system protein ParE
MNVVLTQAALADLRDIGHWIALDDPDRAISFVQELADKCLGLADRPLLYPQAPEAGEGLRKRRHGRYLILYRVARDRIEILHVVHGARNYRELFTRL